MRTAIFAFVTALALPSVAIRADDAPEGRLFVGVTQASASVLVQSHVTGSLTRVAVKEGDAVAKGDLLIEIEPRPYQLALEAAQAKLMIAEAKLQAASIESANARSLLEKNVISRDQTELKLAAEAEAKAALELSKVEVQQAELTLSWTRITAPIDGKVTHLRVSEGGLVAAEQTQILTVASTDPLHVWFNVPEAVLLQLHLEGVAEPGTLKVAIGYANEEGYPHQAQLDLIDSEVDSQTGSVRFRATMPNPKGIFLPGMSARVLLTRALQ